MINGHGDDLHNYKGISSNFSSNIYAGFNHQGLFEHLKESMHVITSYPEPSALSLETAIAREYGLDADCVMVTNGATEAIYLIARTFPAMEPQIQQPTFAEYADASSLCHGRDRIWWICNPNNPTGQTMPKQELLGLIEKNPQDIFIIDASYAAYTEKEVPSAREIAARPNALMLSSMTKDYGIPGIRLGYVVGCSCLLEKVRAGRMPWSVNALAIEAGHYLLAHKEEYVLPTSFLIKERERVERQLNLLGIETYKSDTNILLCRLPNGTAAELKEYLAHKHGILIRDACNFQGLSVQHFRIAVQTKEQNDELLKAIAQWI